MTQEEKAKRMKSIYEASVAYGREHQGTVNIEDYQAGANYVLDEIDKLVSFNRWSAQDLYELIEQLKEK